MLTLAQAYQKCREQLGSIYPSTEALAIASFLFEYGYGVGSRERLLNPNSVFKDEERLSSDLRELMKHRPVQQIVGHSFFCGMKLKVSSDVLIPRPETEELVNLIAAQNPGFRGSIADVCTGSGCIALSLKKFFPLADITGSDISEAALDIARSNEEYHFKGSGVTFIRHDILKEDWAGPLPDIVVSNPPYIPLNDREQLDIHVREFEPQIALFVFAEDPLLFYKRIIDVFRPEGSRKIYFETHPDTALGIRAYCDQYNLHCELLKDMSGNLRFACISAE